MASHSLPSRPGAAALLLAVLASACSDKPAPAAASPAASTPVAATAPVAAPVASAALAAGPAAMADLAQKLVGRWQIDQTLAPPADGRNKDQVISIRGVSEYLPNQTASFSGNGSLQSLSTGAQGERSTIHIQFTLNTRSEWRLNEQLLYEKPLEAKLGVTSFVVNGQAISDKPTLANIERELAGSFLHSDVSAVKTLAIDNREWRFEQELVKGQTSTLSAKRL